MCTEPGELERAACRYASDIMAMLPFILLFQSLRHHSALPSCSQRAGVAIRIHDQWLISVTSRAACHGLFWD